MELLHRVLYRDSAATGLIDSFYILANNETGNNATNDTVSIAFIGGDMAADNLYSKFYNALNTYMSSL